MNTPISTITLKDNKTQYQVKRETGDKIQEALANATQHVFIKIQELGLTLNSADIREVRNDVVENVAPTLDEPETPEVQEWRRRKMDELRESWIGLREKMEVKE